MAIVNDLGALYESQIFGYSNSLEKLCTSGKFEAHYETLITLIFYFFVLYGNFF